MIIYKVLKQNEFLELEKKGQSFGSSTDKLDGFIHLSTKVQLSETLRLHFFKEKCLVLMALDTNEVEKNLRWELSRNNELFPHLYSKLHFNEAIWFAPIELVDDTHIIPPGI